MTPPAALSDLRQRIAAADAELESQFWAGADIDALVRSRAAFFDRFIDDLWHAIPWPADAASKLALFAVGGYGRGELHPHSDIDLLILVDADPAEFRSGIESFVQNLWDLKLDIGHSVRTVEQCHDEAKDDIELLRLRGRSHRHPRRAARHVACNPAAVALPSVACGRRRSGAAEQSEKVNA